MKQNAVLVCVFLWVLILCGCAEPSTDSINDPWVARLVSLSDDKTPPDPAAESFGLNPDTGQFTHPLGTRDPHDPHPFAGTLETCAITDPLPDDEGGECGYAAMGSPDFYIVELSEMMGVV